MTVVFVSLVLLEFPLIKAIRIKRKTAPPTTHTQGCVYHSVVVVVSLRIVVVVVLLAPALSCAKAVSCAKRTKVKRNRYWAA
jgi:hypothetical protein